MDFVFTLLCGFLKSLCLFSLGCLDFVHSASLIKQNVGGLPELVPLFCSYIIKWEKGEEQDKENKSLWSENLQDTADECNFSYHCETEMFRQLTSLISMSWSPNKNFIIKERLIIKRS